MRLATLLILLLTLAAPLAAQEAKAQANRQPLVNAQTGGYLNGRFWLNITPMERIMWISGLCEGMKIADGIAGKDGGATTRRFFTAVLTIEEIVLAVTQFYEEPTNRQIPVLSALLYVNAKANGATAGQLLELASGFRKDAAREASK
jgi:hypothetical protein